MEPQQSIPVSIIEQLEKANPYGTRNGNYSGFYKHGYLNCISKLRELLKDQQPVQINNSALGLYNSWPLKDVLNRLAAATELLLTKKSYDGHDHEELRVCVERGRELAKIAADHQPVEKDVKVKKTTEQILKDAGKPEGNDFGQAL